MSLTSNLLNWSSFFPQQQFSNCYLLLIHANFPRGSSVKISHEKPGAICVGRPHLARVVEFGFAPSNYHASEKLTLGAGIDSFGNRIQDQ